MTTSNYYHIFNHANGNEDLFIKPENYAFFLEKVSLHILPYVKLHAYCLMPNHFHFLIYVKDLEDLKTLPMFSLNPHLSDADLQILIDKKISKSFSNLFSSYAQSFNKMYNRKGSLFMPNMKQNLIEDIESICNVVHYIHANPVHHGFVKKLEDWKYSSYNTFLSDSVTRIARQEIMEIFGGKKSFIDYHQQPIDPKIDWD